MRIPRRIFLYSLATVMLASSSVFLLPQNANAQVVDPLIQNQPVLEQTKDKVNQKSAELQTAQQQIEDIEAKKQSLSQQLEETKAELETLNQKLAEKKAAAEAERQRLERIKNMFVHVKTYAGGSAGNTYAPGNCTWYAKSRRPDLPNNLGNANTWYARAAAQGFNVGLTPKKGAIGQAVYGMHVVYVEGVSLDGQWVTISEMNYGGLYRMNTRTVFYTEFKYIYELN